MLLNAGAALYIGKKADSIADGIALAAKTIDSGAAVLLAVIPPLVNLFITGNDPMWTQWITRALTFLVISCPCALVISIPLSFFGGIGACFCYRI